MVKRSVPKIVVVTAYFYPKIGGVENYSYLLAKNLHSSFDYTVSIVTAAPDGEYKKEVLDGMTVYRLPFWFKISNTPINLLWYWKIKHILQIEKPDIVHLHSPVPYMPDMAALATKNQPLVLTYHSGSMRKNKWLSDRVVSIYENIFLPALFRRAAAVVAISQKFAKGQFPQFADKIYFIPTGVDLERFKKNPVSDKTEVITFVGRIEHSSSWKGVDQLLVAMKIISQNRPNAKLELIGSGDAVAYYQKMARDLGIASSVTFFGAQLGNDLVEAYRRAKVVVLPSTSNAEAFSVSLIEAMASGRPVVGTNIGGTPQVIQDGENGLLVPPQDPKALAQAIEKILSDNKLATRLANSAAEKAQNFAWEIQTKKYSDLFKDVLGKNPTL